MLNLLIESLKIYKLQYIYSILSTIAGTFVVSHFDFDFPLSIFAYILIFLPELNRLNTIQNSGYMKLINKLPINEGELYNHKFLISSSGSIFIIVLILHLNYFFDLSEDFFNILYFVLANIFVWYVVFNDTHKNSNTLIMNVPNIFVLTLFLFCFSSIFHGILLIDIELNMSIKYLVIFITQIIFTYYLGKVYNFFRNKYSK
jgi:hypothetical protein